MREDQRRNKDGLYYVFRSVQELDKMEDRYRRNILSFQETSKKPISNPLLRDVNPSGIQMYVTQLFSPDGWEFFQRNQKFMPFLGILPDSVLWVLYRNPGSYNS